MMRGKLENMNQSEVLEKREFEWYIDDDLAMLESKAANLDSLSGPGVFKISDSTDVMEIGKIEKVPKKIKARSAPDPFKFSRWKPSGNISIKGAFD